MKNFFKKYYSKLKTRLSKSYRTSSNMCASMHDIDGRLKTALVFDQQQYKVRQKIAVAANDYQLHIFKVNQNQSTIFM